MNSISVIPLNGPETRTLIRDTQGELVNIVRVVECLFKNS